MKFLKPNMFIVAVSAIILGSSLSAGDFKRITTAEEFQKMVVGKKLYLDTNHVTIKKNGTLKGKFGGKTLKGVWEWRDGFWCRTMKTHRKDTDCQLWTVNGNQHLVSRDRGKGKSFTYVAK